MKNLFTLCLFIGAVLTGCGESDPQKKALNSGVNLMADIALFSSKQKTQSSSDEPSGKKFEAFIDRIAFWLVALFWIGGYFTFISSSLYPSIFPILSIILAIDFILYFLLAMIITVILNLRKLTGE